MSSLSHAFKNPRLFITLVLGFSSGLPLPLVWGTLKGWLTSEGVDLKTVGLFSIVTLPYSLKFLWSPIVDRFSMPFLHHRTGWMVVVQGLLVVFIIAMGFSNPKTVPVQLAALGLVTAFLSATQDIVIDAYRAELLLPDELGPGAALTTVGARIGLIASGALAFILSDHMPWSTVYLIMALLMSIGIVTAFFAPVPTQAGKPPKTIKEAIVLPFRTFFERSGAVKILLFIIVFKLGDVFAQEMLTPFLIKTGFTRTAIGALNKGLGMTATICGSLFAGWVVTRLKIWKSLMLFGAIQPFSNLLFIILTQVGANYPIMASSIAVEQFCTGMGSTAFVAFLMSLCNKSYTATQFALFTSVMAISRPFVGSATGYVAEHLGWAGYFTLSAFLAIPGLILLWNFRKDFDEPVASTGSAL